MAEEINPELYALVKEALDNALENGYEEEALGWSYQRLAEDLTSHDAELENFTPTMLIPYIRVWRQNYNTTAML